jgi:hypothetical protein
MSTLPALEARIRALETELAALRHRRNSLLRIGALPAEILAEIFGIVQHGGRSCDETRPWRTYERAWTHVMLVCRRFRDVTVHTPALWDFIDYRTCPGVWRDLCLARSKSLSLCVSYTDRPDEEDVRAQWLPRARYIDVDGPDSTQHVMDSSVPLLQTLRILPNSCEDHRAWDLVITSAFLGGTASSLVTLNLSFLCLHSLPPIPSLRRLELFQAHIPDGLKALVAALAQVPGVDELSIVSLSFYARPFQAPFEVRAARLQAEAAEAGVVPLRLRSLLVLDTLEQTALFLRLFALPTEALGISVLSPSYHAYPLTHLDTDERTHHAAIFAAWLRFAEAAQTREALRRGTLTTSGGTYASIQFGPPLVYNYAALPAFGPRSPSACHFSCASPDGHPALPHVRTLRVVKAGDARRDGPPLSGDVDGRFRAALLPHLTRLVVEQYDRLADAEPAVLAAVKEWIVGRAGKIAEVEFVGCHPQIQSLADELEEECVVSNVTWVEGNLSLDER